MLKVAILIFLEGEGLFVCWGDRKKRLEKLGGRYLPVGSYLTFFKLRYNYNSKRVGRGTSGIGESAGIG